MSTRSLGTNAIFLSDPRLFHGTLSLRAKSLFCRQDAGYGIVQCLLSLSDAPVAAADAEAASNGGALMKPTFGINVMEPGYAKHATFSSSSFTALDTTYDAL